MNLNQFFLTAIASVAFCCASAARAEDGNENSNRCSIDSVAAPPNTTIVSARSFEQPAPYCRLDGYVTTTNPGPNRVNFMLALPSNHNGRYVFTVQGGAAGYVPDPEIVQLRRGYAIASTDKGTRPANILDFSWRQDPVQSLDWAHRGVHVVALATQAMTRDYYGIKQFSRFAMGCSGGGDGTLSNAELYPQDFDGYIGAAMTTSNLEINHFWGAIAQRINRNPSAWISEEEFGRIHQALLAEYDDADGARDGLIWRPELIRLDPALFPFLNREQYGTLELIGAGLTPEQGTSYPGFWLANVTAMPGFLTGKTRPPWRQISEYPNGFMVTATGAMGVNGPEYDILRELDYSDRAQLIADRNEQAKLGRHNFDPSRLAGLKSRGGKLILWSGMADQAIPPGNIIEYSRQLTKIFGREGREDFQRTFLVPGLHHCATGENAPTDVPDQLLEAMAQWVENDIAPEQVIVTNVARGSGDIVTGDGRGDFVEGSNTRSYRLCSYPDVPMYKAKAARTEKAGYNNASEWQCISQ